MVTLFRHYYNVRVEPREWISGSVTFCLRDGLCEDYIEVEKKKWDEWWHEWCFVSFPEPNKSLGDQAPTSPWRPAGSTS